MRLIMAIALCGLLAGCMGATVPVSTRAGTGVLHVDQRGNLGASGVLRAGPAIIPVSWR